MKLNNFTLINNTGSQSTFIKSSKKLEIGYSKFIDNVAVYGIV